jgi:hypothetical protein
LTALVSDYRKHRSFQGKLFRRESARPKNKIQIRIHKFSTDTISALGAGKVYHLVVIEQRLIS